jgi:hypothetical protein
VARIEHGLDVQILDDVDAVFGEENLVHLFGCMFAFIFAFVCVYVCVSVCVFVCCGCMRTMKTPMPGSVSPG